MKDSPIQVGDIFKIRNVHWKVISLISYTNCVRTESYPVRKCSANGKEFRSENGFNKDFLETSDLAVFVGNCPVGVKASRDGIQSSKVKRRITYLKNRITNDQKELARLENSVTV